MLEVRTLILDGDFEELQNILVLMFPLTEQMSQQSLDDSQLEDQFLNQPVLFEPIQQIRDEISTIRVHMAVKKYVPLLANVMQTTPTCCGPVGQIDSSCMLVDELRDLIEEAKFNLCDQDKQVSVGPASDETRAKRNK